MGRQHGGLHHAPCDRNRDGDRWWLVLTWWLVAAATGQESYDYFLGWAKHPLGQLVLIGLSWAFFQHLGSGLRHFVLDVGAGYELNTNRFWARATFVFGVVMTAALWGYLLFVKG